jgi:hypothetical protein
MLTIGMLLLVGLGIYHFAPQTNKENSIRGIAPPPSFRMTLNPSSGFNVGMDRLSGFPKYALCQGATGELQIVFTRQYTDEKVLVELWFYGRSPDFDIWENTWTKQNMSLPEGITSSINPDTLELSTDAAYSADLTIAVSPTAKVGSFKVMVDAWFSPSHSGNGTAGTGKSFMLEITPAS